MRFFFYTSREMQAKTVVCRWLNPLSSWALKCNGTNQKRQDSGEEFEYLQQSLMLHIRDQVKYSSSAQFLPTLAAKLYLILIIFLFTHNIIIADA